MKTALIVGIGAVGGHLALHLARNGFDLVVCDPDRVEPHNVGVQPLYARRDVGSAKVSAARRELGRMAPAARVRAMALDVGALGVGAALAVDLVAACVDNRAAELHVARLAALAGRPYLRLATSARARAVDVIVMPALHSPHDPCGGCHFSDADLALTDVRVGCGTAATEEANHVASEHGALAGALAAEIVRNGELSPARMVRVVCGPAPAVTTTRMLPSSTCRVGGDLFDHAPGRYEIVGRLNTVSAAVVTAQAVEALRAPIEEIMVELDAPFCQARACHECGRVRGPGFVRPGVRPCAICGADSVRGLLPAARRLPASMIAAVGGETLAHVDAPLGAGFRFSTGDRHFEVRAHL